MLVLLKYGYITENEARIVEKFDMYLDNPNNSDSEKAVGKWCKQNKISSTRLKEIDIMRFGSNTIEKIRLQGYVRIGEKRK